MSNGQESSVWFCKETQGELQALFCFLSGKQKKLRADERKTNVYTNSSMGEVWLLISL